MKTIKEWKDEDFHVKIKAEFITKGAQSYYTTLSYKPIDCVKIIAEISDGFESNAFERVASAEKYYERTGFFRKKKFINIKEAYDIDLRKLEEGALEYIKDQRKKIDIEKYDREITDGLPDSLDGM